jgi:hypothetical protein
MDRVQTQDMTTTTISQGDRSKVTAEDDGTFQVWIWNGLSWAASLTTTDPAAAQTFAAHVESWSR